MPDPSNPQLFHVYMTFSLEIRDQLTRGIIIPGMGVRCNNFDAACSSWIVSSAEEEDDDSFEDPDDYYFKDPDGDSFEDPGDSTRCRLLTFTICSLRHSDLVWQTTHVACKGSVCEETLRASRTAFLFHKSTKIGSGPHHSVRRLPSSGQAQCTS